MESVQISVVIPSYQRTELLATVVRRWINLGPEQIVVVLDGPHADFDLAAFPFNSSTVDVVELPENRGLSLARIAGLRRATSDVILMADDDILPGQMALERHRWHHAHSDIDLVVGFMPVSLPSRRGLDQSPTFLYAKEYEAASQRWEANPDSILLELWNGNVSIRRDMYESAEEYRQSVPLAYNEDLDLGIRLHRLECKAIFDGQAESAHLHSRTFDEFWRESYARGQSAFDLESRWGGLPTQIEELVSVAQKGPCVARVIKLSGRLPAPLWRRLAKAVYLAAGIGRLYAIQDNICRLIRRSEARRRYLDLKARAS